MHAVLPLSMPAAKPQETKVVKRGRKRVRQRNSQMLTTDIAQGSEGSDETHVPEKAAHQIMMFADDSKNTKKKKRADGNN